MRICFELLELLKAHKKAIRRATVNTFGYIAKAIGSFILFLFIYFIQPNSKSLRYNFKLYRCFVFFKEKKIEKLSRKLLAQEHKHLKLKNK